MHTKWSEQLHCLSFGIWWRVECPLSHYLIFPPYFIWSAYSLQLDRFADAEEVWLKPSDRETKRWAVASKWLSLKIKSVQEAVHQPTLSRNKHTPSSPQPDDLLIELNVPHPGGLLSFNAWYFCWCWWSFCCSCNWKAIKQTYITSSSFN